jgi:AcrR family transcriptional regulator
MASSTVATLPRGRHKLTREAVALSQRGRLLDAMVDASAEHGYRSVTISDVVALARVSRRAFYEHFASKEACFLAAYDHTAEQMIEPLLSAFRPVDDPARRARAYVQALLASLAGRPALAQMLVIEVGGGGRAALERRLRMHRRIAGAIVELNRQTRAAGVDVPAMTAGRALALVGALIELMHATLHDGGADKLPELEDEMTSIVAALVSTSA